MKQAMINYMKQEKNDELYTPEQAIEELKEHIEKVKKDYIISDFCENCGNLEAIETVLNLLKEKDVEIERLKNINNYQSKDIKKSVDYTFELNKEIEKKDKMEYKLIRQLINEGYCCNLKRNTCKRENSLVYECADCIKQYFERKCLDE